MKARYVTSSVSLPLFRIEKLQPNVFDVQVAEFINEVTAPVRRRGADGTPAKPEMETRYAYNLYSNVVRAENYGEMIAGIIHLKFNADDETALINKGIADSKHPEYVAYRDFVEAVKEQARIYFENE